MTINEIIPNNYILYFIICIFKIQILIATSIKMFVQKTKQHAAVKYIYKYEIMHFQIKFQIFLL